MQLGKLSRLCVLILGWIALGSCSTVDGTSAVRPIPVDSVSTTSPQPSPIFSTNNTESSPAISCENVSVSNPAASYCSLLGYQSGMQDTPQGQLSICTLPGGLVCDAWQFLRGKCGQEFSWCALNGYEIQTVIESDGNYSQEYAVCVDSNGNNLGTVIELSGLQALLEACSHR